MRNKQTNANPEDTQEQPNHNLDIQNLKTKSAANSLSRRSFLGRAGASTVAVAAASVVLPSLLSEKAEGQIGDADARSDRSFQIRFNAAARECNVQVPPHTNNGDEGRYATYIGNFSQGLPHNNIGEVDPTAYQALLTPLPAVNPMISRKFPSGET